LRIAVAREEAGIMSQDFSAGDFLVFQIESGFGLLRLLAIDEGGDGRVWHLRGYAELFPDVDSAEAVLASSAPLTVALPHAALTNRAFEATQTARLANAPLVAEELDPVERWRSGRSAPTDRSIRLMLGLR
jgi:hypothetical protein